MADESDFQLQNSLQAIEFAKECVRSGILVNGGGALALLAFWGTGPDIAAPALVRDSLWWFCVGVGVSFLAGLTGYASQTRFAMHNYNRTAGIPSGNKLAKLFAAGGIVLIALAALSFVFGVYIAASALFPDHPLT